MEVTCERCGTVYDFDDALVSERGTSVKCTTCGHQFKVRRAATGLTPDTWIVRTVDGRELEFTALRELQSSIHDGKVSRDDVLVRGNSRPRRLGSIAELEPFFSRIGMTVPSTGTTPPPPNAAARTRTRTPAGLGESAQASAQQAQPQQRNETSVVFSLPNLVARPPQQPEAPPRRPSQPPAAPMAMGQALLGRRSPQSVRPAAAPGVVGEIQMPAAPRVPGGLEDLNTMDAPPPRAPSGSSPMFPSHDEAPKSNRAGAPPPPRGAMPSQPPEEGTGVVERISQLPPPPPPPRPRMGSAPMYPPPPAAEPPPLPHKQREPSAPMFPQAEPPPPPRKPAASSPMFPPAEPPPLPRKPAPSTPAASTHDAGPSSGEDPTLMMERPPPTSQDGPTLMMERPPALQKPAPPKPPPPKPPPPKPPPAASADKPKSDLDTTKPSPSTTAKPTPSDPVPSGPVSSYTPSQREPLSDARSTTTPRRPAAARWIVGVVMLGVAVFGAMTVGRKYLPTTAATQPQEDARLGVFLEQGDRDLHSGDLDAANESYVKASALAEQDARVAVRLARLAAVRADVPWLKARLLAESDPDLLTTKRELDIAVGRAKAAAEKAQSIAPEDVDVTRCRIDAARLMGDLEGARKLVATLPKSGPQPTDDLLFASLDLAEASPGWKTVIERLRTATRDEQNLGRARSLLIYALVRSGDGAGAKAELDKLAALPRPHPLLTALRTFVTANGEEGPNKAVDNAGPAPAGDDALKTATEAIEKGELDKADGLLKELAEKTPGDAKVITAQADLAMKKKDRGGATRLYEKALAADKDYLPAVMALADIKWDNRERQTASTLYRRVIVKGGDASPYTRRAKERLAIFADSFE